MAPTSVISKKRRDLRHYPGNGIVQQCVAVPAADERPPHFVGSFKAGFLTLQTKVRDIRSITVNRSAEPLEPITRGTRNVFADLGFRDAAERQARLRLANALNQLLDGRKLSQAEAAKILGVTQPKVSALKNYKLAGFSVERLMNLLTALDQDVEIVIRQKPRSRRSGRISVFAA